MHESFEAPGAIVDWAESRRHVVNYIRVYEGDELPQEVDGFDYLIVMGGPQSPDTTVQECPHFDAKAEIRLIKKSIDAGKLVLGVCLGAQLIGEAMGVRYEHSPNREIGVFEVYLTEKAQDDPVFKQFPPSFEVGHWHGDMPGLTEDAEVLAYSRGCPRQIVKYSPKVYGFQCHFEFTPQTIDGMIRNSTHELEEYGELPYVEDSETLRSHDFSEINQKLFTFLDHMTTQ